MPAQEKGVDLNKVSIPEGKCHHWQPWYWKGKSVTLDYKTGSDGGDKEIRPCTLEQWVTKRYPKKI
jgi:hypothetical protein